MNQKRKIKIAILLGMMCMFLTLGICIQINTVKNSTTTVGRTLVENELRDSVLRWKQKYENAYYKLEREEEELANLRQKVSSKDNNASNLSSKLEKYNELLGNTEVTGKGIEINTGGIRYGTNINPEPVLIKRYRQLGGELITIGSDAHKLSDIGSHMDIVRDILNNCGFRYYTIFIQRKPHFFKL